MKGQKQSKSMETVFTYVATCLFGLEKPLGAEIDALGLRRLFTMDGRVAFSGTAADCARANINLRCAERVYILVGSFPAPTFDALYEGTKALEWESFIGRDDAFPVKGHSIKSALTSIPDCQRIIKKAAADRLGGRYGLLRMPETGVKYQIEFFIFKNEAHLMLDTSGVALHKRGYRPEANAAPLRETLAAALVMNARLRDDVLLWDPFCGSGTIAIEGVMLMTNRAPGLFRSFAGEKFAALPQKLWDDARDEAEAAVRDTDFRARGSDIDPDAITTARANARRAGVSKYIDFFTADATKIQKPDCRGTLICNPPYGERLSDRKACETLYRDMGQMLRANPGWSLSAITSHPGFERCFGRRADKKRRFYNGRLECEFMTFGLPKSKR